MEDAYSEFDTDSLRFFALDVWDGNKSDVERFREETGANYTILMNASSYQKEKLISVEQRGAVFVVDRKGEVGYSCFDGYKSYACFEKESLEAAIRKVLEGPEEND